MKKILFTVSFLTFIFQSYAQVGIKTQKPIGVFNIDGAKDNNGSMNPAANLQVNDVTVLSTGFTGIGVTAPTHKLHINTGGTLAAPIKGIKIVDGSQTAGYTMTSDANGVGSWKYLDQGASAKTAAITSFGTTVVTSDNTNVGLKNSGLMLHVSPGRWILNIGIKVNFTASSNTVGQPSANTIPYQTSYFLEGYVSSNQTANQQVGFSAENISGATEVKFGGVVMRGPGANDPTLINNNSGNYISGSAIINVPNGPGVDLYLLIQNVASPSGTKNGEAWSFDPTSIENTFYAVPINPQ